LNGGKSKGEWEIGELISCPFRTKRALFSNQTEKRKWLGQIRKNEMSEET
jgi:hypothetical protein